MRTCIICGARVTNINPRANTCDTVCTRAKYNGINRTEQEQRDIKHFSAQEQRERDAERRWAEGWQQEQREEKNQP